MASNDFLPFAAAGGANVVTQAAYAALGALSTGYASGVANSAQLNKTWRQSSIMAAVLAQLIADTTGANSTDDGTTATLLSNLKTALQLAGAKYGYATDTGVANAAVIAYSPAVTALTDGMVLWFKAAAANTGATTLNVNGLGASPLVGAAHSALQGGEIIANGRCMVVWNATLASWVLIECTGGALQVAPGAQSNHAPNLGQFLGLLSANGYIKLPVMVAGVLRTVIIQWCGGTTDGTGACTVTLPITFPNASFVTLAIHGNPTRDAYMTTAGAGTVTTSTCFVSNTSGAGVSTVGVSFIVIGW